MGVVWLAVLGAGTSGHQRFDAPVINESEMNSECFRSVEDAEHTEPWPCGESGGLRGEEKQQKQTSMVCAWASYSESKVKESRGNEHGGEEQGLAA